MPTLKTPRLQHTKTVCMYVHRDHASNRTVSSYWYILLPFQLPRTCTYFEVGLFVLSEYFPTSTLNTAVLLVVVLAAVICTRV